MTKIAMIYLVMSDEQGITILANTRTDSSLGGFRAVRWSRYGDWAVFSLDVFYVRGVKNGTNFNDTRRTMRTRPSTL